MLEGQGFGNRLFCYITARTLALENGSDFAILHPAYLENAVTMEDGRKFMQLSYGLPMEKKDFTRICKEQEERIFLPNSRHDLTTGCYIAGPDKTLFECPNENTLLYGNLQDPSYFQKYKAEICSWLRVAPELEHREYAREDLCVINIRGGEYADDPALFLRRRYWLDAMKQMRRIRKNMQFIAITDDIAAAHRILPEVPAYHGDLAHDYTILKNASYLIVSNSSFAFFPAYTSETARFIIAPKYWARHNVSCGYWASGQNIYDEFHYMDRSGKLFTAQECREELAAFRRTSFIAEHKNPLSPEQLAKGEKKTERLRQKSMAQRAVLSLRRRLHLIKECK